VLAMQAGVIDIEASDAAVDRVVRPAPVGRDRQPSGMLSRQRGLVRLCTW